MLELAIAIVVILIGIAVIAVGAMLVSIER